MRHRERRSLSYGIALAAALALAASVRADDTDIYVSSVAPTSSVPLVMFTLDNSSAAGSVYAGCANVGVGAAMCAPAKYFQANCPTCVLPAATQPLTYFHVLRYALRMTLLQMSGMKVGLMLNHRNENDCVGPRPAGSLSARERCSNGAYVARGFKLLDQTTIAGNPLLGIPSSTAPGPNLTEFLAILDSVPVPQGGFAHPYQGKELFFELFRYLTGQAVYNGHNGYADYNTDDSQNLNVDNPAIDWDAGAEVPLLSRYASPLTSDLACGRIFTVNFMLGASSQDDDSDNAIDANGAGGMVGLDLDEPNDKFESVIGYLQDVDLARAENPFGTVPTLAGKQNVTSYFFTRPTPLNSSPPTFDRTTTEYARQGGTVHPLPLAEDPAAVVAQLKSAMTQILSVSTSFVSGSVPVNVFSRTQVLSDVYLALFQPDAVARPFWAGNVKKLEAKVFEIPCAVGDTQCTPEKQIRLVDALDAGAIEEDGRIRMSALTFWTDGGRIAADPVKGVLAGRDGRHVDRGGAGQKIPGYLSAGPGYLNTDAGARQMYVYPGTGNRLEALNADLTAAVTYQSQLGAATADEALRILKHVRGYDEYDHDSDLLKAEARPWMMADPLHSKPLPINYGAIGGHTRENPAIFIAVATNDGLLHFIRNTTAGGAESGAEAWAFLPVDLLSIQKALALNTPVSKRLYGLDGSPTVYMKDVDGDGNIEAGDGDKVYLYIGMRRGGRAYYALDVTNPTAPQFLWRITPLARATRAGGDAPTVDFAEMGFTFSQPRLGRVQTGVDDDSNPVMRPVVMFGGGYDATLNDYTEATLALYRLGLPNVPPASLNPDDLIGNAVYVVDAETGALVWKAVGPGALGVLASATASVFPHAALKDSIPSTLTVVDTDSDGLTDRIVVGDTGGNVWRADLGGPPSQWRLTQLARLGRHVESNPLLRTKRDDRRFFHEPDFVLSQDENGAFDAVVIGSGDREDPLDYGRERSLAGVETLTDNAVFMIKDRNVAVGAGTDADVVTPSMLADVTSNCLQNDSCASAPNLAHGWRIHLRQGKGEKMLAAPLTAANRIYFTTYLPPSSSEAATCGPSEGGGLFHAVWLKNAKAVFNFNIADGGTATSPNSAQDRFEALDSAGIPTEAVYINLPDDDGREVKCVLGSDLNCRALPGATRFRTFWQRGE